MLNDANADIHDRTTDWNCTLGLLCNTVMSCSAGVVKAPPDGAAHPAYTR